MTVCRAMVRPGFTKDFGTAKLLHGFEQDWLTQELAQHLAQQLPQSMDDGNKQRHGVAPWRIVTGRDVDYRAFETLVACKKSQTPNQAPGSEAQRLLVMRKGFYGKARTRTLSSKCAAQLAIAMEKALGILFPDGPGCQGGLGFRWVIDVAVKGATQLVWIDLSYKEDTLRWKVEADDLHAVLSLWVHAAWAQRNEPRPDDGHAEADDGTWICGDVCEPSLKALGCRNYRLRHQVMKDLETWATQSRYILAEIMEIWKVEVERQKKEERKKKKEEKKKKKEEEGEQKKEGNRGLETNCARAVDRRVESQDSIVGLYASDILFSFMWSMAKTLRVRLGREDKRIQTIGPQETKPWGNTTMTDLISAFREASHWSEHETCLGVISPLSILGKLPIQPWFHTMSEAIMDARRSKDRALIRAATSQAIQKAQSLVFTYKAGTSGLRERGLVWLQEQQRGAMYVPFGFESGTIFLETPMGYLFDESNSRLFDQVRWKGAFFEALEKLWEIQCNTKTFTNRKRLPAHFDFTALHGEAARGNKIGSDAPAELKALVNVQDVTGWTPIFYACAAKNSEMVRQLFDLGADATLADIHGYTVAHHACLSGCEETLTILASQRVDLEAQAINGAKPIHLAAGKGRDDVITHLDRLEQMYPGTRRREAVHLDFDNRTPMHWAAAGGHVQVLKALKGDVNVQDDRGWSSLHIAILAGRKHTISTLHQLSADVERRDFKGRTPLILACAEKRWEVVGELIDIGAKVDAADSNDMTPLHYLVTKGAEGDDAAEGDHAAKRDSSTMIPILTKGLDGQAIKHLTELRNRDGHTPLQLAAMKGGLDTINKLLELGADADLANSRGESPLFLALAHAKKDKVAFRIAKALVRGENSLRVKSVDGRSLLDVARSRQFSNVVSFLEAERERLERDSLCWKDDWHARDRCKDEEVLFLASAHCSCRSPAAERTLR